MTHHNRPIEQLSKANVESLLSFGLSGDDDRGTEACMALFDGLSKVDTQQLMLDLRAKVLGDSPGPLSFQRIIKSEYLTTLADRSFLEVLTDESSTSDALDAIAAYGRILMQPCFPQSTRRTGAALLAGAKTALAIHYGRETTDSVRKMSAKVLEIIG